MVFHSCRKTVVEPVKCKPAKSLWLKTTSPSIGPLTVTILMTPSGSPAALNKSIITLAEYIWVSAGFHTTTLPIMAGAAQRLAQIEVKLKGVIANTKPSKGRCSSLFHIPGADSGCSAYNWVTYSALNLKKSINSQAASISAWNTFLDWASMVAAFSFALKGPASNSAAFKNIDTLWCQGISDHCFLACKAAFIAKWTCSALPKLYCPKRCWWSWGGCMFLVFEVLNSCFPMYIGTSILEAYISW